MNKIKVLHTKNKLSSDGATAVLYNFARELQDNVQFDFLLYSERGNDWASKFEELGCHIYYREAKCTNVIMRRLESIKLYYEFLRTHHYNIVHIDTDSLERVDILFCAWLCGYRKRIYHSHNSKKERERQYTNIFAYRWIMQHLIVLLSTDLLACSTEAAKWMFPIKYLSKVKIIKNGIYAEQFKFDPDIRRKIRGEFALNDSFVIGCVARFVKQKNHEFLIDIFAKIVKEEPNAKLLLIGDGELKKDMMDKVNNLNISDKVIFIGATNNVGEYLSAMDIYVMPSLFEGLSLALLEAQASGLYCITSSNVSRETEISNRMEFISLNKNIEYWKEQILSKNHHNNLLEREDAWIDVINAGYDIKKASKELLKIYNSNN